MILVTGGNGFIGMHTTRKLLDAGESVVVGYNNAQREPDFWKDEIGKRVFSERVDTTNAHAVMEAAMKCKQAAEPDTAEALSNAIHDFQHAYGGEH